MKRIILLALALLCIVGTVHGYGLYLKCPESIQVGLPMKCSIDSDFPPGKTFNFAFYQSGYTSTQVSTEPVTLQTDQKTLYKIVDTTGLPGGTYKAELQFITADEGSLRSDSITSQIVKLIDRSSELEITSPMTQDVKDALRIEGTLKKGGSGGVEIEVRNENGRVFGPQWIGTTNDVRNGDGVFTKKVPVTDPGTYTVDFKDSKGFVGRVTFTVTVPTTPPTAVPTTTPPVVRTTKPITATPTPWPTATQSPVSPLTVIGAAGLAGLCMILLKRR